MEDWPGIATLPATLARPSSSGTTFSMRVERDVARSVSTVSKTTRLAKA